MCLLRINTWHNIYNTNGISHLSATSAHHLKVFFEGIGLYFGAEVAPKFDGSVFKSPTDPKGSLEVFGQGDCLGLRQGQIKQHGDRLTASAFGLKAHFDRPRAKGLSRAPVVLGVSRDVFSRIDGFICQR